MMEMRQKLARLAPAAAPAASKHRADVERMAPGTDKHSRDRANSLHRANGVLPEAASLPAPPPHKIPPPRAAKTTSPAPLKPKGPTQRALMRHAMMLDNAATKLQTALRRIQAKAAVGDLKIARDDKIYEERKRERAEAHAAELAAQATKRNLIVFVFVPLLFGAGIIAATFADEELARAVLRRQGPPSNWRQAIECCTDQVSECSPHAIEHTQSSTQSKTHTRGRLPLQRVTIPVPHAARPDDLVGVQWYEQGRRSVSYERLVDSRSFEKRTVSFELPWTLVGHNHLDGSAPCMPKARSHACLPDLGFLLLSPHQSMRFACS